MQGYHGVLGWVPWVPHGRYTLPGTVRTSVTYLRYRQYRHHGTSALTGSLASCPREKGTNRLGYFSGTWEVITFQWDSFTEC